MDPPLTTNGRTEDLDHLSVNGLPESFGNSSFLMQHQMHLTIVHSKINAKSSVGYQGFTPEKPINSDLFVWP